MYLLFWKLYLVFISNDKVYSNSFVPVPFPFRSWPFSHRDQFFSDSSWTVPSPFWAKKSKIQINVTVTVTVTVTVIVTITITVTVTVTVSVTFEYNGWNEKRFITVTVTVTLMIIVTVTVTFICILLFLAQNGEGTVTNKKVTERYRNERINVLLIWKKTLLFRTNYICNRLSMGAYNYVIFNILYSKIPFNILFY